MSSTVPEHDGPPPVRVALSNDYEIALLGLAQMLARHPEQVQIVDLTTLSRIPHEADVILYDTFGRLPDDDPKLRRILTENTAKSSSTAGSTTRSRRHARPARRATSTRG